MKNVIRLPKNQTGTHLRKRAGMTLVALFSFFSLFAQIPTGYYNQAADKKGHELYVALHEIIKEHNVQSYSSLWTHFYATDKKENGKVWDIYSDIPNGTPPYEYTFGTNQCGNYNMEGDCYNREHSLPQEWFGNGQPPMYTDLFHLYPTDGWVNGKRSNFPYGEVKNATWTSRNGSKLGNNSYSGYSGTVFEPVDSYKGDLARTYFYMSTCYLDKTLSNGNGSAMFSGASLKSWAVAMLIEWHENDPVSQKEIDRNNAIYRIQNNRNPFIDYPELVGKIFAADSINPFNPPAAIKHNEIRNNSCQISPNPTSGKLTICDIRYPISDIRQAKCEIEIYDMLGRVQEIGKSVIGNRKIGKSEIEINISHLPNGFYFLKIDLGESVEIHKIIKQ